MVRALVCWIGLTDLKAARNEVEGSGPVAGAVAAMPFDVVRLLCNYPKKDARDFLAWLDKRTDVPIEVDYHQLRSPTDFDDIFPACRQSLKSLQEKYPGSLELTFHLSPGTPHMASTWLILSESEFPARLIDSSLQQGVREVRLPVSLTAEWLPSYIKNRDARLKGAAPELPPPAASFKNILHRSEVMQKVIYKANKVAPRTVPVVIEGESGTGKELFARAIHDASLRCDGPFIPVNCGAIPKDLIESTLFGHVKGAFSGATAAQAGKFEQADGGTLFLDELGELPLDAQVQFLRILEDNVVWRVGATSSKKVDVRIIAATNRSLIKEVASGRFREDLFYRLAVAVLKLPPLRHREGDLKLLIHHLLEQVNRESREEPSYKDKKISPEGEKIMLRHAWPGNVREMLNTLRRLAVWSDDIMISADDVTEALLGMPSAAARGDDILGQELSQDFDLTELLDRVERHYIEKAWLESGKRKKEATEMLGLSNYQTFSKRLEKYGLK